MRFGLVLLGALGVLSIIGSFIPQGRDVAFYHNHYSPNKTKAILVLKMDDIYHSFYFIVLFGALCLNLFLCSISRLSSILKKIKEIPDYKTLEKLDKKTQDESLDKDSIIKVFKEYGFKRFNRIEKKNNKIVYYSKKNSISYLGSWLIHTGILLTIVFYGYGQLTYFTTNVYGVPGEAKEVLGTAYRIEINDFNIQYREDGTVEQYISQVDLKQQDGDFIKTEEIYVNNPMRYQGYAFYQTATGWATDIKIFREEELIKEDIFYESTSIMDENSQVLIQFTRFYPDFLFNDRGIINLSNQLNNPRVLYSIFFRGERMAMNVAAMGEAIQWNEFTFIFNNPQRYTYFQVNKMKGKLGVLIGSLLLILGLYLCFYRRPKELVIIKNDNILQIFGNNQSIKDIGFNQKEE